MACLSIFDSTKKPVRPAAKIMIEMFIFIVMVNFDGWQLFIGELLLYFTQ